MRSRWFSAVRIVSSATAIFVLAFIISPTPSSYALPNTISSVVNTTSCSNTLPELVNGGFEDFSNPASDSTVATGSHNGSAYYGIWHGYGNGPDQILFLKPSATPASGESSNYVTGWRSTSPLIEIQRQVGSYTTRHNNAGVLTTFTPAASGIASSITTSAGGSYFDLYSGQPGEGTYWAELNAIDASALYQDVEVPSSARLFWSLKHRGRSDTNEEMKVLIGPVVNNVATTTQQTSLYKFSPTNSDKYIGTPTYNSFTLESRIISKLSDGWNRFEGTYAPDTSVGAPSTRTMRLQFEAVSGAFGWTSFGNMLDDIQFTAFMACPASQSLTVGQTATLDVTGQQPGNPNLDVSYGVRQALSAIGNPTASASEFSTSGNVVSFTPSTPGNFSVDYEVEMNFGGQTYTAASRISYTVAADPNAPAVTGNALAATGANYSAMFGIVTGLLTAGALGVTLVKRRRS